MNLKTKIEEIRRQPEHIRLRWIWGCVGVSMLIILAIWSFSLTTMFNRSKTSSGQTADSIDELKKQLDQIKKQSPSLKNYADTGADLGNEGIVNQNQNSDFAYPDQTKSAAAVQSSNYADLQTQTPANNPQAAY